MSGVAAAGVIVATSFAASWAMVALARRYALRVAMLDRPSDRSSHAVPTPRGGGVGVVVALLTTTLTYSALAGVGADWKLLAAIGGIVLVAGVGWSDDHRPLGAGRRLAFHLLGGLALLPLALDRVAEPIPVLVGLAAWWTFCAVSAINVVNFMDGIDGFIGTQMALFGAHLAFLATEATLAWIWGLALFGSCTGFLVWNRPPAKIFLGDVGSGGLGLAATAGGVMLLRAGGANLASVCLPLYPMFLDATVTLLRRAVRGERISTPHRTHLYQRLATHWGGHGGVTLLYGAVAAAGAVVAGFEGARHWILLVVAYAAVVLALAVALDRHVGTADALSRDPPSARLVG